MRSSRIVEFLSIWGTRVREDNDSAYVELMMDDHKCIEFDQEQYYIPEHNILWDIEDEEVYDYLIENYLY